MKNAEIWTVKTVSEKFGIPKPSIITAIRRGHLDAAKLSDIWMIYDNEKFRIFVAKYENTEKK